MDDPSIIVVALFWTVGFGTLCRSVAKSKGLNADNWTLAGAIFGLLAFLLVLVAQPNEAQVSTQRGLRVCPFCAESIKPAAIVCRYCGRDLEPISGGIHLSASNMESVQAAGTAPAGSSGDKDGSALDVRLADLRAAAAAGAGVLEVESLSPRQAIIRWTVGRESTRSELLLDLSGHLQERPLEAREMPELVGVVGLIPEEGLVARRQADPDAPPVTRLRGPTEVDILERQGGWSRIAVAGEEYWVSGKGLLNIP